MDHQMNLAGLFTVFIFIAAILLVILILLQHRGASLGAGFGASGELYTKRRGLEKSMFGTTVVMAMLMTFSILALLVVG